MNGGVGKMGQVMQELMPHFCGNGVSLGDRQMGTDGNIQFRMQPMPHPPGPYLSHRPHFGHVLYGVSDVSNNGRVNAV